MAQSDENGSGLTKSPPPVGLPTPDPTPELEEKRAQAETERLRNQAEGESGGSNDDDSGKQKDAVEDTVEDTNMEGNIPIPSENVMKLYSKVTPVLYKLRKNPSDAKALKLLEAFNAQIPETEWKIASSFFVPHYAIISDCYTTLQSDPTNEEAKAKVATAEMLVDEYIGNHHFPKDWGNFVASDYINSKDTSETAKSDAAVEAEAHKPVAGRDKPKFPKPSDNGDGRGANKEGNDVTDLDEHDIPMPPDAIMALYSEATPLLSKLKEEPDNEAVIEQLDAFNSLIMASQTENESTTNGNKQASNKQWIVSKSFFKYHYQLVLNDYTILRDKINNEAARSNIAKEKTIIDIYIKVHHFPAEWGVLDADDYLLQKGFNYPWATTEAADGLIVGTRKQGRGRQVCIERLENGRLVRRLEPASEVGHRTVDRYENMTNRKILSDGQRDWRAEDRSDFEKILWVTKSQLKMRNTAARKTDPKADCCVLFKTKGINILTVSSLMTVLGDEAIHRIEEICQRHGIQPPWDAGWVSEYHDEAKRKKNLKARRDLRDQQANTNRRRALKDVQAKAPAKHRSTRGRRRRSPSTYSHDSARSQSAYSEMSDNSQSAGSQRSGSIRSARSQWSTSEVARQRTKNLEDKVEKLTESLDQLTEMFATVMKQAQVEAASKSSK